LNTPYITFKDSDELTEKSIALAKEPELRKIFGDANYEYCRQLHDEKPVVDRFLKIVEEI